MSVNVKDRIEEALRGIINPAEGIAASVQVNDAGVVIIMLEVDPRKGGALESLRQTVEREISRLKGVTKVTAVLTAQKRPEADPHGMNKNPVLDVPAKNIILVASGKGGVGKSTVAANLAAVFGKQFKVGLLDADIYGPSQPIMMGEAGYKPVLNAQKKYEPVRKHGLKMMSIGFLVEAGKALVWRGPMVQTAVYQLLRDVAWAEEDGAPLDYLIIDMPPGTGDVQLTLAQKIKATGVVIVSTPQDIALIDARRAVEMFRKTNVPILGIVENMSVHVCANCGHAEHIFGQGGAREEAKTLGVQFLGEIPLARTIRTQSDAGMPVVLSDPDSAYAQAFDDIAQRVNSSGSNKSK